MAVISFFSSCKQETGNTVSAITYATYLGITRNQKILYVSTGLNDNTVVESLWPSSNKKTGFFGQNTENMTQNGIEELYRIIRSNRTTPEIITDYTRVALRDRLEILTSYIGEKKEFNEIASIYAKVIELARRVYDYVIVDVDKELDLNSQKEILETSDIIVATIPQKLSNVEKFAQKMENDKIFNKNKTLIAIGKYHDNTKFNARNISRNLLKRKEIVNTIPFNTLILEGTQEGKMIDVLWNLINLRIKDEKYFVIEEIKRLETKIDNTVMEQQLKNT